MKKEEKLKFLVLASIIILTRRVSSRSATANTSLKKVSEGLVDFWISLFSDESLLLFLSSLVDSEPEETRRRRK
jgi:hypothetical protein